MKSWKTTVVGLAGGAIVGLTPVLQTGKVDIKSLIIGAAIGAIGVFAKDHDVTGDPPTEVKAN